VMVMKKRRKKVRSSLGDFIVSNIKTKEIIKSIKRQNGSLLGRDVGKAIDRVLDAELGNKKSYQVERYIVPFIVDFCDGITEELMKYED